MSKTEQMAHNIYWLIVRALGIISAYLFIGYAMPATWFFQDINVDSGGGAIDMSFTTEFNGEGTGKIINTMNCTSDLLIREKEIVEVRPLVYKEIEITRPILTGQ